MFTNGFQNSCGALEFLIMPFGLANALATFQSLMNNIFQPYLVRFVLVFFDDILVSSPFMEAHIDHLSVVLQILYDNPLYAKWSKCEFGRRSIKYLGYVIAEGGVSTNPEKTQAIVNWSTPKNIKGV